MSLFRTKSFLPPVLRNQLVFSEKNWPGYSAALQRYKEGVVKMLTANPAPIKNLASADNNSFRDRFQWYLYETPLPFHHHVRSVAYTIEHSPDIGRDEWAEQEFNNHADTTHFHVRPIHANPDVFPSSAVVGDSEVLGKSDYADNVARITSAFEMTSPWYKPSFIRDIYIVRDSRLIATPPRFTGHANEDEVERVYRDYREFRRPFDAKYNYK